METVTELNAIKQWGVGQAYCRIPDDIYTTMEQQVLDFIQVL